MVAALEGKLNNNWIISSQVLKDGNKSKQTSKSVIMVKPNHALSQLAQGEANRSSLRKVAGSERKNEKEETQLQNSTYALIEKSSLAAKLAISIPNGAPTL